ncbi:START domain-containing protein [Flavobacterium sp.]|uniref:START domain-containing protein n=1 Tax=Flavobacterium sp. TaxID=239 RepID=UPI0028BEDE85|nr:START domain-containing protein [Flavobacterium sp.]
MKGSKIHFTLLVLLFLVSLFSTAQKKSKTELAIDKEGIKIYLTKLDTTPFKEYRAVMTVKANIDTVAKQILDIKSLQKWNYKTRTSELIRKTSDTSWIFYMVHHLGWPVQDRDHVSRVTLTKKANEQTITILPANNIVKEKEGILRLKNFRGFWYLKKISENQTLVIQQVYGNPGGSMPAFMVNMVVTKGPFESFRELRKRVENLNKK